MKSAICCGLIHFIQKSKCFLYNIKMRYLLKTLSILQGSNGTNREMVSRLYHLSLRSLVVLIIFALIVSYYLYSTLQLSILFWGICIVAISLIRLATVYYFKKHEERYSTREWYRLFFFSILLLH